MRARPESTGYRRRSAPIGAVALQRCWRCVGAPSHLEQECAALSAVYVLRSSYDGSGSANAEAARGPGPLPPPAARCAHTPGPARGGYRRWGRRSRCSGACDPGAFALAQFRVLAQDSRAYLWPNLVGSAVLAVDAWLERQWGFVCSRVSGARLGLESGQGAPAEVDAARGLSRHDRGGVAPAAASCVWPAVSARSRVDAGSPVSRRRPSRRGGRPRSGRSSREQERRFAAKGSRVMLPPVPSRDPDHMEGPA